jgi:hypothetical protein
MEVAMRDVKEGKVVDWAARAEAALAEFNKLSEAHRAAWAEEPSKLYSLQEAGLLSYALVYGWLRCRLEAFVAEYRILQVEEELRTLIDPTVVVMSRLDVLVEDRNADTWVINWKTTKTKDPEKLFSEYENDPQMWTEAAAAEAATGRYCGGTILSGFYKGVVRNGQRACPLIYAYVDEGNGKVGHSYKQGARKVLVDGLYIDAPGTAGLRRWLDQLPMDLLKEHFYWTPPIIKVDALVKERWGVWAYRERAAAYVLANAPEEEKLLHFGPRDGFWCQWCPFKRPCRSGDPGGGIKSMVENGELVVRVDHHGEGEE